MARFQPLTVTDVRHETSDTVSIAFRLPEDLKETFAYQPGQYLTLRATLDGEEVRRSYSICAGLPDGELRVAVKTVPGGRFSTWANDTVKPGDTIEAMSPMGRFVAPIEPDKAKSYVLFAAGSGITPVMSIIRSVLALEPDSDVTLFYGNRTTGSIIFREALEDLKNRYMGRLRVFHVLSREKQDVELFQGRVDTEKAGRLFDSLCGDPATIDHVFVCGPEPMIHGVREAAEQRGLDKKRVHFELFATPGAPSDNPAKATEAAEDRDAGATVHVTLRMDGDLWQFDMPHGETVLDAAHDAGLDVPFSCKGGVCATCRCKVTTGAVEMDNNYALDDDEVEAGFVLSCQSRPTDGTDTLEVDFDAR